jgi:hypothetical protein
VRVSLVAADMLRSETLTVLVTASRILGALYGSPKYIAGKKTTISSVNVASPPTPEPVRREGRLWKTSGNAKTL